MFIVTEYAALKKINFFEIFPFYALGSKFDLDVK